MKLLRIAVFLAFSTAAAFGQYMNYWSWIYVDPTTGLVEGGAETEFQDPNGNNPDDYVDATLSMYATSTSGQSNYQWYEDNVGLGDAIASFQLQVNALGIGYNVNSQHEVSGNMMEPCQSEFVDNCNDDYSYGYGNVQYIQQSATSSAALNIPPAPSIKECDVSAPEVADGNLQRGLGQGEMYYCVDPAILITAEIVVGPDVGTTNNPNYGPFPFSAYDMPYGTSYFQFIGTTYGVDVGDTVPNSSSVTRTRYAITDDSWARFTGNIVCDEATYQNQNFYLKTIESPNDVFTYVVSNESGPIDDLSYGGAADVYVDSGVEGCSLQVGQPPLLGVSGTNTVTDSIGGWNQGMTYPTGPTLPPQTEYYQSADNSWKLFFQIGADAQICTSFYITSDDILVGTRAYNECLNQNYPF